MLHDAVQSSVAKFGIVAVQTVKALRRVQQGTFQRGVRGVQSGSEVWQGHRVKQSAYRIKIQNCCVKGFALFCLMGRNENGFESKTFVCCLDPDGNLACK